MHMQDPALQMHLGLTDIWVYLAIDLRFAHHFTIIPKLNNSKSHVHLTIDGSNKTISWIKLSISFTPVSRSRMVRRLVGLRREAIVQISALFIIQGAYIYFSMLQIRVGTKEEGVVICRVSHLLLSVWERIRRIDRLAQNW